MCAAPQAPATDSCITFDSYERTLELMRELDRTIGISVVTEKTKDQAVVFELQFTKSGKTKKVEIARENASDDEDDDLDDDLDDEANQRFIGTINVSHLSDEECRLLMFEVTTAGLTHLAKESPDAQALTFRSGVINGPEEFCQQHRDVVRSAAITFLVARPDLHNLEKLHLELVSNGENVVCDIHKRRTQNSDPQQLEFAVVYNGDNRAMASEIKGNLEQTLAHLRTQYPETNIKLELIANDRGLEIGADTPSSGSSAPTPLSTRFTPPGGQG